MQTGKLIRAIALGAALAISAGAVATAQGLFSPVITVDERAVTGFEIQQRVRLLEQLNTPGNLERLARDQLIEDRLKLAAAADAGQLPGPDEIAAGVEEFAARANLTPDQFIAQLAADGIAEETFIDFVRAGVAWRNVVGARFGPRVQITEAEVDRALQATAPGTATLEVLLSEIIIAAPPAQAEAVAREAERISQLRTEAEFSEAARRFSATASAEQGGRLDWVSVGELPEGLRRVILALQPGEVTQPLPLEGAVALFQLRGLRETAPRRAPVTAIEFATVLIPGGRSEAGLGRAADVMARADTCDDLFGVVLDLPPEALQIQTLPPGQIPDDVAFELAKLDPGEISIALTRAEGTLLLLTMLCGRTTALTEDADREAVRQQLRNERLASLADGFLAELRASAVIVER